MKTLIQKSKSFVIDMGLGLLIANIALVVFVVIALGIFYIFDNQNVAYMLSAVIVAPFIILAYLRMYAGRYNILDNKDERTNGGHNSNGVVSSVSDRMV